MTDCSRIPKLNSLDFDGALLWFSEMKIRGLMFHPDDDPADIIQSSTGEILFTTQEAQIASETVNRLFYVLQDSVYEAAYPIIINAFGNHLDS